MFVLRYFFILGNKNKSEGAISGEDPLLTIGTPTKFALSDERNEQEHCCGGEGPCGKAFLGVFLWLSQKHSPN